MKKTIVPLLLSSLNLNARPNIGVGYACLAYPGVVLFSVTTSAENIPAVEQRCFASGGSNIITGLPNL